MKQDAALRTLRKALRQHTREGQLILEPCATAMACTGGDLERPRRESGRPFQYLPGLVGMSCPWRT